VQSAEVNSSVLGLDLKVAKVIADLVFTESLLRVGTAAGKEGDENAVVDIWGLMR